MQLQAFQRSAAWAGVGATIEMFLAARTRGAGNVIMRNRILSRYQWQDFLRIFRSPHVFPDAAVCD
jgi:hypothetical protein